MMEGHPRQCLEHAPLARTGRIIHAGLDLGGNQDPPFAGVVLWHSDGRDGILPAIDGTGMATADMAGAMQVRTFAG